MSAADTLAGLSLSAQDPNGLVAARLKKEQALREMQRSLELQAGDPQHTFSGATHADVADEERTLAESPNFGDAAQKSVADTQATNADLTTYNRPDVTAKRTEDNATKLALATMPNVAAAKAQGENALNLEAAKAKNESQAREDVSKANDLLLQRTQGGGEGAGGSGTTFRPDINAKGQLALHGVPKPPQQISQEHGAAVGLSQIPTMRAMIDTLGQKNDLGMAHGRVASALVGTGLDSLLMSPKESEMFNQFKNQLSLMKSNMAMVHGGARGGSNVGMAQRFDELANVNQSPAALHGAVNTFERWLTQYAGAKTNAERDAADAEFGVGPGSSFGRSGGGASGGASDPSTWEKVQ